MWNINQKCVRKQAGNETRQRGDLSQQKNITFVINTDSTHKFNVNKMELFCILMCITKTVVSPTLT